MKTADLFKWRHYQSEIILLNGRWYYRYPLSYRNLEEMMMVRGLEVDHSTINRWVLKYSPELDKRCRRHLKPTNDSLRVDETYTFATMWRYLYRAVDSDGYTLDFLLSAKRDAKAAKRFLTKALNAVHTHEPRVINVDKNPAYPLAVEQLQEEERIPDGEKIRQAKIPQQYSGARS